MESLSSSLHGFLKNIGKNLSLPDKKFLRDGFVGLLRAGQPIICQMARHLPHQQTKFISHLHRLDQRLIKNSDFDNNVKEALPKVWPLYFQHDNRDVLVVDRGWECEEGIRFLKSQVNLEKIRTFRWCAIRRLVLLAVLVRIYLGWIVETHPNIGD